MQLTATMLEPITGVISDNGALLIGITIAIIGFNLVLKLVRRAAK